MVSFPWLIQTCAARGAAIVRFQQRTNQETWSTCAAAIVRSDCFRRGCGASAPPFLRALW